MRVIAGEMKGRQVKAVPGNKTRPTGDKIKEATFHKIGPFFESGICLDLFAGSGSMGIEALSRGMEKAIFIDTSQTAIQTIHKNIKTFKLQERSEVYRNNALRALDILAKKQEQFDLIIVDPPYEKVDYDQVLEKIIENKVMREECIIYCEHAGNMTFPDSFHSLEKIYEKKYNETTMVTLFIHT